MPTTEEPKGARFEVYPVNILRDGWGKTITQEWEWQLVGAEGPVAKSPTTFDSEKETRSHIAANKGRLGNARRTKVITVEQATEVEIDE